MKKILSLILVLSLILSFAACSSGNNKTDDLSVTKTETPADDLGLLDQLTTVTFTIPKIGDETPETELTEEQKEMGFLSVTVNEDGSSTYTMKKGDWKRFVEDLRTSILDHMLNTSENGSESVYSYEINKDFNKCVLYVDYDLFQSKDIFSMLNVHMAMAMLQYINGANKDTMDYTIELADYTTKEVLQTVTLPESDSE